MNLFRGRIERGKAYIGSMAFDAPPQAGREARLATLYIRPHQLEIEQEDRGEAQFKARVAHVNPAGPLVKVDLVAEWGDPVRVEMSQERYRALALEPGDEVFVRPKDMSLFTQEPRGRASAPRFVAGVTLVRYCRPPRLRARDERLVDGARACPRPAAGPEPRSTFTKTMLPGGWKAGGFCRSPRVSM